MEFKKINQIEEDISVIPYTGENNASWQICSLEW